jgi:4,5-dihydroxyphthalate decarboxylase
VWLRGFLTEQYGIDLRASEWFAYEDGHIYEHRDPAWVQRQPEGAKLAADFLDGRLDFGILGNELPKDDRIRPAIADPQQAAEAWSRKKGFIPINHVIGVNEQVAREHSAAILAAYDAMREVTEAAAEPGPILRHPVGLAALRGPFTQAAAYALEQEVLPKPVEFDELIDRTCTALGVSASRLGG